MMVGYFWYRELGTIRDVRHPMDVTSNSFTVKVVCISTTLDCR